MTADRFARLLQPRSIACIGGRFAAMTVQQCRRMGYRGALWPVHPHHDQVHGLPAFRRIEDLPAAPDAAFVAVNRDRSIEIIGALAAAGAGGAVCYASGFGEVDDGRARQAALVAAAGSMPMLGPNCYGLINYLDGALLWPDIQGGRRRDRGVALLTQSGNIALNLTMTAGGLPIAYVAAIGNQAQTGLAHLMQPMIEDERVSAIGLLLEGIGDLAAFDAAARAAHGAGKPVVALKFGRSEAGARLALSHTASLAGSGRVTDALFARWGIAQLRSIPAFIEALKLLHVHGPLPGADIATLSCSGGEAAILADSAAGRSVRFRPFTEAQAAAVAATVDPLVTVSNPFDYHTFMWGDGPRQQRTFARVLAAGFDITALVLDHPRPDLGPAPDWQATTTAWQAAATATGARTAMLATTGDGLPEAIAESLTAAGIMPAIGVDDFFTAVEAATTIGAAHAAAVPQPLLIAPPTATATLTPDGMTADSVTTLLDEAAAKAALAEQGVPVPEGAVCSDATAAVAAAARIGYPVVVKLLSTTVAHKSDIGGVALGLGDAAAVRRAADSMLALAAGHGGRILVERMITDAVAELIVGIDRDPVAGPVLVIGAGGVLVDLLEDSAVLTLPTTAAAVHDALAGLRCAPLFQGYRGRPVADLDAAVAAILALARFAATAWDWLAELDINPLLLRPAGNGVVAADALVATTVAAAARRAGALSR